MPAAANASLSAEQWRRLRQHFEALCDLPPGPQRLALAALDLPASLHQRLLAMLGGDQSDSLTRSLQRPLKRLALEVGQLFREGQQIGAYRLLRPLGRGGMGLVWLAERADGLYDGQVAIKFVGDGAFHRQFELERRLLARLDHRGIARLLDAGTDDSGIPYVVMEYVEGEALHLHVRHRSLGPLQCIALVRQCAEALAHAHGRLVLHRDLKPDNLLVDPEGEVHLLDFGIAGLLGSSAEVGPDESASFYTPRYAAPEQVAGEPAGTAADIYSLGVILFELLSGQHPAGDPDGSDDSLRTPAPTGEVRRLRDVSPALPPLSRTQLLDLELVLARALARDPAQRYGSAEQLADDLARVAADRPVSLRLPARTELVRRWSRRHPAEAAMVLAGLLAFVIGGATAVWYAEVANEERDLAVRQSARAERIADFMTGLFSASQPVNSKGEPVLARDLLATGRRRLADGLEDDPVLRASLLGTVGDTYRSLGDYDAARDALDEALSQLPQSPDAQPEHIRLLWLRGKADLFQGRYAQALPSLTAATALSRDAGTPELGVGANLHRAVALINLGQLAEADAAARESLEAVAGESEHAEDQRVSALSLLSNIALLRGDLESAHGSALEVLRRRQALHGDSHHGLSTHFNNLAAIELRMGRLGDAAHHYRLAIDIAGKSLGQNHVSVALPLSGLAAVQRARGEIPESLASLAEAIAIHDTWEGPKAGGSAYPRFLAAELMWLSGDTAGARQTLANAPHQLEQSHGARHANACRARVLEVALDDDAPRADRLQRLAVARQCLLDANAADAPLLVAELSRLRLDPTSVIGGVSSDQRLPLPVDLVPPDPALAAALAQHRPRLPASQ